MPVQEERFQGDIWIALQRIVSWLSDYPESETDLVHMLPLIFSGAAMMLLTNLINQHQFASDMTIRILHSSRIVVLITILLSLFSLPECRLKRLSICIMAAGAIPFIRNELRLINIGLRQREQLFLAHARVLFQLADSSEDVIQHADIEQVRTSAMQFSAFRRFLASSGIRLAEARRFDHGQCLRLFRRFVIDPPLEGPEYDAMMSALNRLRVSETVQPHQGTECLVCLEQLMGRDRIRLPCGHHHHHSCFLQWIRNRWHDQDRYRCLRCSRVFESL